MLDIISVGPGEAVLLTDDAKQAMDRAAAVWCAARHAALIGLSCLLAACVTALVGPISFVGIAVPYMTKKLLGTAKPMAVLPGCFLLGGVFCMACDWIARTAFSPTELAISTVTAFFGAPVVIMMALKRGGGHR